MSFRRIRDAWDEFLKHHANDLQACGIPDYVIAKRMRFLVFLDHGYDEWGWADDHHAFFDSNTLTDEQITRLAELVANHIDESYRIPISSRWQRSH